MSTPTTDTSTTPHPVVTPDAWLAARRRLLEREKELTRLQDAIAAERRALPWVRVTKRYEFDDGTGRVPLEALFGDCSQLLVQHFMLGPGWERGCPSCTYMADHTDGMRPYLAARDVSLVAVSRAPWVEIEAYRARMGWGFRWVSSHDSDFNFDFHVSFREAERARGEVWYNYALREFPSDEAPGISLFQRDDAGQIFHTYSTYGRGLEVMMGAYHLLDLAPKGRAERDVPYKMEWVHHAQASRLAGPTCCGCG